ncbi:MAG TPA: TlpA disulfide reductase family protein [bacterium]|nr:TlpA disulfide reductase family protein [bacterium]
MTIRTLTAAAACALGLLLVAPAQAGPAAKGAPSKPGKSAKAPVKGDAPAFEFTTLDGRTLKSEELYGTKGVVLAFWASWCGPCHLEAPILNALHKAYQDRLTVIGVSVDDAHKGKAVARFAARHKLEYAVVHDTEGTTADAFEVGLLPKLVVVDLEGNVALVVNGALDEEKLRARVTQALQLQ